MGEILDRQVAAQQLRAGLRNIANLSGRRVVETEQAVADQLCISERTLQSWMSPRSIPGRIDDTVLFSLVWLSLRDGNSDIAWLSRLIGATSIIMIEPPTPEWLTACLRRIRLKDNTPGPAEITRLVERLFPPEPVVSLQYSTRRPVNQLKPAPRFYGRENELNQLENWLTGEKIQVVAVLGMGGSGKSALVNRLLEQLKPSYDFTLFCSLLEEASFQSNMLSLIHKLGGQSGSTLDNHMPTLLDYLHKSRVLLVLDGFDQVLAEGELVGRYRPGYESYGQLLRQLCQANLPGNLIITSREKPTEVKLLEGKSLPVRSLLLKGLANQAGRELLEANFLQAAPTLLNELSEHYSGNPQMLEIVAATIRELFDKNGTEFIRQRQLVFGGVRRLLEEQFERLSIAEQILLYQMMIAARPLSLDEILNNSTPFLARSALLEALESLWQRSWLEKMEGATVFTLENIVMEYLFNRLLEQFGQPASLNLSRA